MTALAPLERCRRSSSKISPEPPDSPALQRTSTLSDWHCMHMAGLHTKQKYTLGMAAQACILVDQGIEGRHSGRRG